VPHSPNFIFKNPLLHYAHIADVFRMEKLLKDGGIYLDIDTLCLKPFQDLRIYDCVLAYQDQYQYGICNATMLSKMNAKFLNAWYREYKWFRSKGRDEFWDEHSVRVPLRLSRESELHDSLHVLDREAFFPTNWALWEDIFVSGDLTPFRNSYSIHLWDTSSKHIIDTLTVEDIKEGSSAYCQLARQFVEDETDE
jgi:hypothetical protein